MLSSAILPEATVRSLIVADDTVVVARFDVPVTTKVFVVVALVTVRLVIKAVSAEKTLEKSDVEVLLLKKAFVE